MKKVTTSQPEILNEASLEPPSSSVSNIEALMIAHEKILASALNTETGYFEGQEKPKKPKKSAKNSPRELKSAKIRKNEPKKAEKKVAIKRKFRKNPQPATIEIGKQGRPSTSKGSLHKKMTQNSKKSPKPQTEKITKIKAERGVKKILTTREGSPGAQPRLTRVASTEKTLFSPLLKKQTKTAENSPSQPITQQIKKILGQNIPAKRLLMLETNSFNHPSPDREIRAPIKKLPKYSPKTRTTVSGKIQVIGDRLFKANSEQKILKNKVSGKEKNQSILGSKLARKPITKLPGKPILPAKLPGRGLRGYYSTQHTRKNSIENDKKHSFLDKIEQEKRSKTSNESTDEAKALAKVVNNLNIVNSHVYFPILGNGQKGSLGDINVESSMIQGMEGDLGSINAIKSPEIQKKLNQILDPENQDLPTDRSITTNEGPQRPLSAAGIEESPRHDITNITKTTIEKPTPNSIKNALLKNVNSRSTLKTSFYEADKPGKLKRKKIGSTIKTRHKRLKMTKKGSPRIIKTPRKSSRSAKKHKINRNVANNPQGDKALKKARKLKKQINSRKRKQKQQKRQQKSKKKRHKMDNLSQNSNQRKSKFLEMSDSQELNFFDKSLVDDDDSDEYDSMILGRRSKCKKKLTLASSERESYRSLQRRPKNKLARKSAKQADNGAGRFKGGRKGVKLGRLKFRKSGSNQDLLRLGSGKAGSGGFEEELENIKFEVSSVCSEIVGSQRMRVFEVGSEEKGADSDVGGYQFVMEFSPHGQKRRKNLKISIFLENFFFKFLAIFSISDGF